MNKAECCPKFNPKPWDGKILNWKSKKFIKGKARTFFFIPINFGSVITKLMNKVEAAGAKTTSLCLSDHHNFSMDLLLEVNKEVPGAKNITLSGKFLSKVYEGDFKDTGVWCKDFKSYASKKKLEINEWYMWYTTCPKCAKKYGKNYTVIIAKVN
ncbi:MAG: hydrolase [Candidatus Nanoarchaeia archaeon]|jgi:hypothetical protein